MEVGSGFRARFAGDSGALSRPTPQNHEQRVEESAARVSTPVFTGWKPVPHKEEFVFQRAAGEIWIDLGRFILGGVRSSSAFRGRRL